MCVRRKAPPSNPPTPKAAKNPSPSPTISPPTPAQVASSLNGNSGASAEAKSSNKNNKNEETINYEINKTQRTQVREGGQVKRLSVAVVVDGIYKTEGEGKDAKTTYVPRSDEEMTKIKALAQSAVNFDSNRGDTIDVVNMQFAAGEAPKDEAQQPRSA